MANFGLDHICAIPHCPFLKQAIKRAHIASGAFLVHVLWNDIFYHLYKREALQPSYPFDPLVSRSVDNWRAGTYRSPDSRASNRFSPGYSNSPRYSTPGRSGTSQALASGLDALSLNKMNVNPDMMDAAWQAFWSTLSNNSGNTGGGSAPAANSSSKW